MVYKDFLTMNHLSDPRFQGGIESSFGLTSIDQGISSQLMQNMIHRIVAHPKAFFKHQRLDEPDLTDEEKYSIAEELFSKFPVRFLERYGQFLLEEDMPCLDGISPSATTDYLKKRILGKISQKPDTFTAKNRRFKKMEELLKEGEYFSDEEMKKRCPLIYEQMLRKYEDGDQFKPLSGEDVLSTFCFRHLDAMKSNELYKKQLKEENDYMDYDDEEHKEDSDEECEENCDEELGDSSNFVTSFNAADKVFFRKQFIDFMKERFMQGLDEDCDYEKIDNDERLDSFDIINQDAQEKYFDDDNDDEYGASPGNDDPVNYTNSIELI